MNRVSMMGELAASLSHEILHPIATARNNARAGMRFLEMKPPNLDETREALACVVRDTDRAKDIVGRMRDHIKKAPLRKERFDLNSAINEVIVLAQSAIHRNSVSVQTRLADGLLPVMGDCVQLQQVLLNLILNAAEAMGLVEEGARELLISTREDQTGALVTVRDSGGALIRSTSIESSTPFTPRSPVEQGWGCRYAVPSSKHMEASCGRKRTNLAAPYFSLPCRRTTTYELSSIGVPDRRAERTHRSRTSSSTGLLR
ncbi:histidine kinase dimerization/phospho-acceptor domain-containing protein [Bradyrhizobium japonicum]